MKISIRKMFVLLAIVLSLVAVQAVWALDCSNSVTGTVTLGDGGEVTVGDTTISGVPDYLNLSGVLVTIYYSVSPCGDYIACSVTIGEETISLRPRKPAITIGSTTEATLLTDSGALNCNCKCYYEPEYECHCVCGEISGKPIR